MGPRVPEHVAVGNDQSEVGKEVGHLSRDGKTKRRTDRCCMLDGNGHT